MTLSTSNLKSVPDFLDDHTTSDEVIILGMSPSTKTKAFKNGTFDRLQKWCDHVGLEAFDFHNVIPNIANGSTINQVDVESLLEKVQGKVKIIALGGFVSKVCYKYGISHYKIDHPSPRNRNLNDPDYERMMLENLRKYLND